MKTTRNTKNLYSPTVYLFVFLFIVFGYSFPLKAQSPIIDYSNQFLLPGIIVDGDTVALVWLETVTVQAEMKFASKRDKAAWDRLKNNVKKAYPYAIIAAARFHQYENELSNIPDELKRKAYMKEAEKQLKREFEGQLKKLTVRQGRILIKLIDRENGKT